MLAFPNQRIDTAFRAATMAAAGCLIAGVIAYVSVPLGATLGFASTWWFAGGGWRAGARVWSPGLVALAALLSFFTLRYAFTDASVMVHALAGIPLAFVVGLLDRPLPVGQRDPFDIWSAAMVVFLSVAGIYLGATLAGPKVDAKYDHQDGHVESSADRVVF